MTLGTHLRWLYIDGDCEYGEYGVHNPMYNEHNPLGGYGSIAIGTLVPGAIYVFGAVIGCVTRG